MDICAPHAFLVPEEPRRGHWIPELELQVVASLHVGAWNQTQTLYKDRKCFSTIRTPSSVLIRMIGLNVYFVIIIFHL